MPTLEIANAHGDMLDKAHQEPIRSDVTLTNNSITTGQYDICFGGFIERLDRVAHLLDNPCVSTLSVDNLSTVLFLRSGARHEQKRAEK